MMFKKINRKDSGFTLIELQVSILIASFILIAAISLFIFHWKSFAAGNAFLDIYSDSKIAMRWMAKDIRWAASVVPTSSLGAATYTTSDTCIVLQVPSIMLDPNDSTGKTTIVIPQPPPATKFDEIIYYIQGNDLHRIVYPNTETPSPSIRAAGDKIVATHCSGLTFSSSTATSGGTQPLSYFVTNSILDTINVIYISLPLSEKTFLTLSNAGATATPTTGVKLRNKQ